MIYPRFYKDDIRHNKGIILIDALLALSVSTFLVGIIIHSSLTANDLFQHAREKQRLLDVYDEHGHQFSDMMPYESRRFDLGQGDSIEGFASWYGNDRIETAITASSSIMRVPFFSIRKYPYEDIFESRGQPLCSVDFTKEYLVGSFPYFSVTGNSGRTPESVADSLSVSEILLPIPGGRLFTDLEVRNGIAYISSDSTSASDADLHVVDMNNPGLPILLSEIHSGPGIESISLTGPHVYAAVSSSVGQLHVFELNTLENITIEKKYQLPLPYATATPPLGSAIFYSDPYVFLGTTKWEGEEFNIIDVSNPADPSRIGGFETSGKINDIYARDGKTYIADSDEFQLRVLDISEPSLPVLHAGFNPPGWQRQEGKSLSYFEDVLKFGRTTGGFNIKDDHEFFYWATSSRHSLEGAGSEDIPGGIYGIVQDRFFDYVIGRKVGEEFKIFSRSNPAGETKSISLPIRPGTITCDGSFIYVLAEDLPVIYQISFSK